MPPQGSVRERETVGVARPPSAARLGSAPISGRPGLVFFYSRLSGRCRRVDGYLAQVLQRRHNHGTFDLFRVEATERPELVERFRVERLPTFLVFEQKRVRARLEDPRGCREIEEFLQPWLRGAGRRDSLQPSA